MAERKSDIVYDLTSLCLNGNMENLIRTFMEMNPLEAEDCLNAFWSKASVGNLRKYHKMITEDEGPQMPAELLDESDLPDDVEELRIIVDDEDDWSDENSETKEEEEDEYDEAWFDI